MAFKYLCTLFTVVFCIFINIIIIIHLNLYIYIYIFILQVYRSCISVYKSKEMATGILILFYNVDLIIAAVDSDSLGQFTPIPIKLLNLT